MQCRTHVAMWCMHIQSCFICILYGPRSNGLHLCLFVNNSICFNFVYQKHGAGVVGPIRYQWQQVVGCWFMVIICQDVVERGLLLFLVVILCPPSPTTFSIFVWGKKNYKDKRILSMSMISTI